MTFEESKKSVQARIKIHWSDGLGRVQNQASVRWQPRKVRILKGPGAAFLVVQKTWHVPAWHEISQWPNGL